MDLYSNNNRIYLNRFGYNTEANAWDDGVSNHWDDGLFVGNWWKDYDGVGTYLIPGDAQSVDHFPLQWDEDIPENTMLIQIILASAAIGIVVILVIYWFRFKK
jgi:hypothetical protein